MELILKSFFSSLDMASWILKIAVIIMSTIIITDSAVSDSVIYDKKSILEPEVPLLFPNDSNRYKIIANNSTLLEKFLYHSINMSNPEVIDMLNIQELKDDPRMSEIERILKDPVDKRSDQNDLKVISPDHENPKLESELLQEKGATVEKDSLESHNEHLNAAESNRTGRWIAMSAAILLTVAATAYISTLLWRKSLERRFGSRQILVEDEEVREEYKHSMSSTLVIRTKSCGDESSREHNMSKTQHHQEETCVS